MDKKTIECSFCSGKGFVPCKTCGGNTTVKCPDCGGEGREYKIICQTCHKGYVTDTRSLDDDKTLCPDCHGNYREDLGPCKKCDGKGVLSCETCNGTGKTECPVCKGKGKFSCGDFIKIVHFKDVDAFIKEFGCEDGSLVSCCYSWHGGDGDCYYGNAYARALRSFKVHDVTPEIWKVLLHETKQGNGDAAFVLGMCYAKGIYYGSTSKQGLDYEKTAKKCFKKSAEARSAYGQFMCGCSDVIACYSRSDGIDLINKACAHDIAMAWVEMAIHYMIKEDLSQAIECCKKILAIKDQGGECDDAFCDFAKAHVDFLTRAIKGKSVKEVMEKWWHNPHIYVRTTKEQKKDEKWSRMHRAGGFWGYWFGGEGFWEGRRRLAFVLVGIFFGLFGLQFALARRWKFFWAYWVALIVSSFFPLAYIVCLVLWLGSILFMKHCGDGSRM